MNGEDLKPGGLAVSEQRKESRGRTYLGGKIHFNGRYASVDCLIRDMSKTGARLKLTNTVTIPAEFDLVITAHDQTKRARIAWRQFEEAGIAFI